MSGDIYVLTVQEAHELCGLPIKTLYRLCADGEIKTKRIGRSVYIRRASLVAYMNDDGGTPWQNGAGAGTVRSIAEARSFGSRK